MSVTAENIDLQTSVPPCVIGSHTLHSRLIMGTGRFDSFEIMRRSLEFSRAHCVTVAVRRERLHDSQGRNILEFIDNQRHLLLPNTAGCLDAESAVRCARMGREILQGIENPGWNWVKLEVLGDHRSLLPDPWETLTATERLTAEGFQVLCYSNDDPITARRLKAAGAVAVMPAGSPIGSGQGVANPNNIRLIIEQLKEDDPDYPVIVDAGIGTASDAVIAMEIGADAVLLNSAVAGAIDPPAMALAMHHAVQAGYYAGRAGRIERTAYAVASSPELGVITPKQRRSVEKP